MQTPIYDPIFRLHWLVFGWLDSIFGLLTILTLYFVGAALPPWHQWFVWNLAGGAAGVKIVIIIYRLRVLPPCP